MSSSGYESIEANINCISNKKPNLTSFSNPNYLCPDAKTVVEKQKNKFGETIVPPICQLSRDESHQNFAAALNSPAESLISDYQVKEPKIFFCQNLCKSGGLKNPTLMKPTFFQDFHARLNHDLVEMNPTQSLLSSKATVMKITTFSNAVTPVLPRRKPRPLSTGK